MEESVIKRKYGEVYKFFVFYWDFIKKHWNKDKTSDYYAEMEAEIVEFIRDSRLPTFCEDLLMKTYQEIGDAKESYDDIRVFYKDWWEYINTHYELGNDPLSWEQFMQDTSSLSEKYKNSSYCMEIIYVFVNYKAK